MVRNYSREMDALTASLGSRRPRLLLHSCCGPCSSAVLERLAPFFRVTVFFYNPNILPAEEFEKRLFWQRRLLERAPFARGVELLAPERDEAAFRRAVRGLGVPYREIQVFGNVTVEVDLPLGGQPQEAGGGNEF